jgi:hypothetical protein
VKPAPSLARWQLSRRSGGVAIGAFTLLLALSYLTLDHLAPAGRRLAKIAGVDTVGYFGIAHSILFDHDFNLNNEYARVPPASRELTPVLKGSGLPANHWPIGYSLVEIPFLAVGTLLDAAAGHPADGYSGFALHGYGLCNIFLTGVGLYFLFLLLCEAGQLWGIGEREATGYALFTALATYFATSVGYYSFAQLSHASTALFASIFLWYWWKIRSTSDAGRWFLLGIAGGFLSISRWQDGIFLMGPLLFDLLERDCLRRPWPWLRARSLFALAVALCWIPQLMELKSIYGRYFINPYLPSLLVQGDVAIFPPPFVWKVLMSSQNGWFTWTPAVVPGILGLIVGAYRFFHVYAPWIFIVALEVALVGSLSFWHGVDSFSSRYLTSTVPVVALGLFTLLCALPAAPRRVLVALILVCCVFTVLFAVQLRFDLIPSSETLTVKEMFLDKLQLPAIRQQKIATRRAEAFLAAGDAKSALETLDAAASNGDDRDVLALQVKVYRVVGNRERAEEVEGRLKRYLDTRLY